MENNEFKTIRIKIRMCYYFDDIIKLKDFDFNNNIYIFLTWIFFYSSKQYNAIQ